MSEAHFTSIIRIFVNQSTLIIIIQLNITVPLVSIFDVVVVIDILNMIYYDTYRLFGSICLHNSHLYWNIKELVNA